MLRNRRFFIVFTAWALLLLATATAQALTVYVNTRFARIRSGKTAMSPVVGQATFGQALAVLGDEGTFWRVQLPDGKLGFLAKAWAGADAPSKDGIAEQIGKSARGGQGGGVSYTAGARGLTEQAATDGNRADLATAAAAVVRMEKVKLAPDAIDKFLSDGKLGDYKEVR